MSAPQRISTQDFARRYEMLLAEVDAYRALKRGYSLVRTWQRRQRTRRLGGPPAEREPGSSASRLIAIDLRDRYNRGSGTDT